MVKCADCGFLSVRNISSYNLDEASIDYRNSGVPDVGYNEVGRNPHNLHKPKPLCFARYEYLADAIKNNPNGKIADIIESGVVCKGFTEWYQGFTPKEHREMMDRERMLSWQAERDDEDRKWRSGQNWKLAIIAGVFAVIGALMGRFL